MLILGKLQLRGNYMNIISNCSFINCGVGISAPKSANLLINGAYFERVGTCYEFRNDDEPAKPLIVPRSEKISLSEKIKVSRNPLEKEFREIIQNLFNLEINSIINKDFYTLKKIRILKGLIGSKEFQNIYSSLNR
jgi:hypothetical protein